MLLIDKYKKNIYYYDNNCIKEIVWNFDDIKDCISKKYKLNIFSENNIFFNYFVLSKNIDHKKDILIFDTKRKCNIIIDKKIYKKINLISLFKVLFFLDTDVCLDVLQKIDIYWKIIKYKKTIRIKTYQDIIKLWLIVEWYKKWCGYYSCYINFSYALWEYQEINNYIENKCKWTDTNKKIALEKAISESVERISWCSKINNIYKYNERNTYLFNHYIDKDEFTKKKCNCDYVRIYNIINKLDYMYCPINIINYPYNGILHSWVWNSNWMATHKTLIKAEKNALMETIERDCFIMMWLLKRWIYKLSKNNLDKKISSMIDRIEYTYNVCLHICIIKFDNQIPVSLIIATKNNKSIIGTWIGGTLNESIEKWMQEILWMIGFFDEKINEFSSQNIVMKHIWHYIDPLNFKNIKRIIDLKDTDRNYIDDLFINKYAYKDMLKYYENIWILFYIYKYENILNKIFKRYTVRIISNELLPIYFWLKIPNQIRNSKRLCFWKKRLWVKKINLDLHPMW